MHGHDAFAERGRSSEEAYFRGRDQQLVDKLRKVFESNMDKEELRKATGIQNDEVLDRMVQVSAKGEMLTAFKLLPLVEIAWADGSLDKEERAAVMKAAIDSGVPRDGEVIKRLEEWLTRGPAEESRAAWYMFAGELKKTLSAAELATFRNDLVEYCKRVAQASGGLLGVAFQVSKNEQLVIDKVTKALS
jgi:uncharacterized tellurite resistance protein B-like protein